MIISILLLLVLLLVTTWVGLYALVKQQGRILLRLDELEQTAKGPEPVTEKATEPEPEGLEAGSEFPQFEFSNLSGDTVSRADFHGKRVLLVHWNFQCGFCDLIAPELAALLPSLEQANVALVLLAYGDVPANQKGAAEHKLNCPILLMNDAPPPEPFARRGTPVAYLLDEQGRTDAPFASGADQVLSLAQAIVDEHAARSQSEALQSKAPAPAGQKATRHRVKLPGFLVRREVGLGDVVKGVTSSIGIKPCVGCERRAAVLNRWLSFSGGMAEELKAGMNAPLFELPDLTGRMVSLKSYRGRRVLLVFTDPQCGPCDELAPHLVQLHQQHANNGLSLIMVGRGDADENRRKAEQHRFPFPMVIQSKWKVSQQYGTFATPVAFLVGEDGVLAQDAAVGTDPILTLAHLGHTEGGAK